MKERRLNHWPALNKHRITTTSSSLTCLYDLDNDTLVEILSRLPTIKLKHMVRCKSVSKLWHSLISKICIPRITCPVHSIIFGTCTFTPLECGPYLLSSLSSPNHKEQLPHEGILPFKPSPRDFLDCSNGLLLFVDPSSKQYYIYNPSTEESVAIPSRPQNRDPWNASLIFNPFYKLVHIQSEPFEMSIFSPETSEWTSHNLDLDTTIVESAWVVRAIFFSGAVYKLSYSGHLLKFDIDQVGARAIELPKNVIRDDPIGCLGVSQGSLHYAWDDGKSDMLVWTLAATDEWLLKRTICHQYFIEHPLWNSINDATPFSVYAFHPSSDLLYVGNLSGIYTFDHATKRLENVIKLETGIYIKAGQYVIFLFSPNLTSLDSFGGSFNHNHLVSTGTAVA